MRTHALALVLGLFLAGSVHAAERPARPRGLASLQLGKGGKWIDVDYGRPLLRGRHDIFGAGASYGKEVTGQFPVWRLGANETTRLKTELPMTIGGKTLAPGNYDLFAELKNGAWTLIVSTQPAIEPGESTTSTKMWGAGGYDPRYDVARVPMSVAKSAVSVEQLTIGFVDVSAHGAKLQVAWDHTVATAPFSF